MVKLIKMILTSPFQSMALAGDRLTRWPVSNDVVTSGMDAGRHWPVGRQMVSAKLSNVT